MGRRTDRDWFGLSERRWRKGPDEEVRPAKTLWDWLQLLLVPAVLAVLAIVFNAWQSDRDHEIAAKARAQDRAIATDARLDETLRTYVSEVSALVLERGLLTSRERSGVRAVARTLTLTTLRQLDGRRKGEVMRYLAEADLLRVKRAEITPIVNLEGADLRRVDLTDVYWSDVTIFAADLRDARFDGAVLEDVDLQARALTTRRSSVRV
jgi:Pentapeptide repeats (8 copies)